MCTSYSGVTPFSINGVVYKPVNAVYDDIVIGDLFQDIRTQQVIQSKSIGDILYFYYTDTYVLIRPSTD